MKKGYLCILISIISFGIIMSISHPVYGIGKVNIDGVILMVVHLKMMSYCQIQQ